MTSPFHWQITLDSGVRIGFTGQQFGSLATPAAESRVPALTAEDNRARLNSWAAEHGYAQVRFMNQTHSCTVLEQTRDKKPALGTEFDSHFSESGEVSLGVLVADCLPILLCGETEQGHQVIAAVHAGRVGLLGGIIQDTVATLRPKMRTTRKPLAVIGPAICGSCYEVPEQLQSEAIKQSGFAQIASKTSWGTPSLDLPRTAEQILIGAGYEVIQSDICTLESSDYYSFRGGDAKERNAGIILMPTAAPR